MNVRGKGGLAGKERKAHVMDRFERDVADQLIDEFEHAEELNSGEHFIRVNHGSDLLNRISMDDSDFGSRPFSQLDLPFTKDRVETTSMNEGRKEETLPDTAWKPFDTVEPFVGKAESTQAVHEVDDTPTAEVIIPRRYVTSGYTKPANDDPFSWYRFLSGCCLGTAAVALIFGMLYLLMS